MNYNIDFIIQLKRLLPPLKRKPKRIAWLTSLLKPLQWLNDVLMIYVAGDASIPVYNGDAILRGVKVRFDNKIYETLADTLENETPFTNPEKYFLVLNDWRGAKERVHYSSQILIFEYLLNRWFGTSFRQPVDGKSDIYIEELDTQDYFFRIGENESESSEIAELELEQKSYIGESWFAEDADFVVKYKLSQIDTSAKRDQLRSLINQHRLYGTKYKIQAYI